MKKIFIAVMLAVFAVSSAHAVEGDSSPAPEGSGLWQRFTSRLAKTWESEEWDMYVPVYAWHNRLTYDRDKINKYNEHPWGAGIGRSMIDEDGDFHTLFVMGFMDSNDHFEPFGGYAFMKNYYLDEGKDWAVGLGFTLGVTARHEYSYIPIPAPLPLIGVQYKRLAVQAAYIPGPKNDGNVLFTWLRWHFD